MEKMIHFHSRLLNIYIEFIIPSSLSGNYCFHHCQNKFPHRDVFTNTHVEDQELSFRHGLREITLSLGKPKIHCVLYHKFVQQKRDTSAALNKRICSADNNICNYWPQYCSARCFPKQQMFVMKRQFTPNRTFPLLMFRAGNEMLRGVFTLWQSWRGVAVDTLAKWQVIHQHLLSWTPPGKNFQHFFHSKKVRLTEHSIVSLHPC